MSTSALVVGDVLGTVLRGAFAFIGCCSCFSNVPCSLQCRHPLHWGPSGYSYSHEASDSGDAHSLTHSLSGSLDESQAQLLLSKIPGNILCLSLSFLTNPYLRQ